MRATGYRWWIERFRRTFELVDVARIDHFRGFVAYWAVPHGAETALDGQLAARARAASSSTPSRRELGELPLVAEDLGVITPRGRPAARRARAARAWRDAVPARRRPGATRIAGRPTSSRSPTPARTTTTRSLGWWELTTTRARDRALDAARAAGIDEDEPSWLLDRGWRSPRARALGDRAGAGPARPRQQRPHEHARARGRQLVVPARARRALDDALAARLRKRPAPPGGRLGRYCIGGSVASREAWCGNGGDLARSFTTARGRRLGRHRRRFADDKNFSRTGAGADGKPARSTAPTSTRTTARRTAAVHTGRITAADGGTVTVETGREHGPRRAERVTAVGPGTAAGSASVQRDSADAPGRGGRRRPVARGSATITATTARATSTSARPAARPRPTGGERLRRLHSAAAPPPRSAVITPGSAHDRAARAG